MSATTLSAKSKEVLQSVIENPGKTIVDIAAILSVSVGQVNGALQTLKKNDLITIEDGKLTAAANAATVLEYGLTDEAPVASTGIVKVTAKLPETALLDEEDLGIDGKVEGITKMSTETLIAGVTETTGEGTGLAAEASAPATIKVGSAMAAIAAGGATSTTPATPVVATESKASKARAVFLANPGAPRKVLMALMTGPDIGLSVAGANTYLYNFRKEAGMVVPRGTEVKAAAPVVAETPAFVADAAVEAVVVDAIAVAETTGETAVAESAAAE